MLGPVSKYRLNTEGGESQQNLYVVETLVLVLGSVRRHQFETQLSANHHDLPQNSSEIYELDDIQNRFELFERKMR